MTAKRRAVFLDRDGVLNRVVVRNGVPCPPCGLDELEIMPGVFEACESLRHAGYLLVVVTNQPDVARGTQEREVVEAINNTLRSQLPIDDVRVCYHDDSDRCDCRKPGPGMLLHAASDLGIDVAGSFLVGDRWRDVECGRRAGCTTIMIDYGYGEQLRAVPDRYVESLAEASEWIISLEGRPGSE